MHSRPPDSGLSHVETVTDANGKYVLRGIRVGGDGSIEDVYVSAVPDNDTDVYLGSADTPRFTLDDEGDDEVGKDIVLPIGGKIVGSVTRGVGGALLGVPLEVLILTANGVVVQELNFKPGGPASAYESPPLTPGTTACASDPSR